MFTIQIPADGSSVPVADFSKAADESLASYKESLLVSVPTQPALRPYDAKSAKPEEKGALEPVDAQIRAGFAAAKALVSAGAAGKANVYAVIGGHTEDTPGQGTAVSVGVYARPGPVTPIVPAVIPELPRVSPYETGPKPEEIAREAAATGKPLEQVAKELGAATVTVVQHKDGVTTSTTKATGAVIAPPIPASKANMPTSAEIATARSTGSASLDKATMTPSKTKAISATPKAVAAAVAQSPKARVASTPKQVAVSKASAPKAVAANAAAQETNEQTAKPAPGSFAKQVAKDRAGK